MSEKYKFRNPDGIYSITTTVIHWIDLFTRKEYAYEVIDSLNHSIKNKGLIVHAWCIMPSHLHAIIRRKAEYDLSSIMRDFKRHTSKKITRLIKSSTESRKKWLLRAFEQEAKKLKRVKDYKVWQDGNHPVELDANQMIEQRLEYLHQNPVEAGYVAKPEDWLWNSAGDYAGIKGLIDVSLIN